MGKSSLQLGAFALVLLSACGAAREKSSPHPAEQMPDQEVPVEKAAEVLASPRPIHSTPVEGEAVSEGCEASVVPGSAEIFQCCSTDFEPADACRGRWVPQTQECTLSFQRPIGELWKCATENPSETDSPSLGEEPHTVVRATPAADPTSAYQLREVAQRLGLMAKADYLKLQVKYVSSKVPACNYFLIVALCEAGYCKKTMPLYRAAGFDDYFVKNEWKTLTLDQLKGWFIAGVQFDVVLQKDGVTATRPGHVAIPVGMDEDQNLIIAQGSLGTITNEVTVVDDDFVLNWDGGFSIFVKAD